jgi:electron transfer flavoprotein beta subunit
LERLTFDDLNLNPTDLQTKSQAVDHYLPPKKEAGRVLKGDLSSQVGELVSILHETVKVI